MKQNKETLKQFFETGDKPTQQQYSDLIDSYIDAKQPEGEANRRFVIDELGEVSVTSDLVVSQSDWNQTDGTQPDFIKNKPVIGGGLPVDFYEEGTWTPSVAKGTTAGSTGSSGDAYYTRIGNTVHFSIYLTELNTPDAGGNINITLPPSLPVDGFSIDKGFVSINTVNVGTGGTLTPSDVILEGIYSTNDKVYIKDRYGRNTNIIFQNPGTSLILGGMYKTNVYNS